MLAFFLLQILWYNSSFHNQSSVRNFEIDTVGTVYHVVIYMQSNKIHKVF